MIAESSMNHLLIFCARVVSVFRSLPTDPNVGREFENRLIDPGVQITSITLDQFAN